MATVRYFFILVVGDQEIGKQAGQEKNTKDRKAEELISQGFPIRISKESDFREMAALANSYPHSPVQTLLHHPPQPPVQNPTATLMRIAAIVRGGPKLKGI